MAREQSRVWMIALGLGATLMLPGREGLTAPRTDLVEQGRAIVERNCARCHAIGVAGESPLAAAPQFRRLHERYDVEAIAEGLAEGLTVGHGPMPEWTFPPADIAAIIAYLRSIQATDAPRAEPESPRRPPG